VTGTVEMGFSGNDDSLRAVNLPDVILVAMHPGGRRLPKDEGGEAQ
jgi:hypothetical protein